MYAKRAQWMRCSTCVELLALSSLVHPKTLPGSSQNSQDHPKTLPGSSQNSPRSIPKLSQDHPKTLPGASQNSPRIIPKYPGRSRNIQEHLEVSQEHPKNYSEVAEKRTLKKKIHYRSIPIDFRTPKTSNQLYNDPKPNPNQYQTQAKDQTRSTMVAHGRGVSTAQTRESHRSHPSSPSVLLQRHSVSQGNVYGW